MTEPFKVTPVPPTAVLLNPLAWILWILDLLVWVLTIVGPLKWLKAMTHSSAGIQVEGNWRSADARDALHSSPFSDCRTVHDLTQRAFKQFGDRPACGTRTYLGEHKPEGAKFPLKKFGETKWITYSKLGENVANFGAGLVKLGMKPLPSGVDLEKTSGPHTLLVFEETCREWITATFGAFSQSLVVATSYATLGMSAVVEALNETEATVILCNIKDVKTVANGCKDKCKALTTIVYTTNNSTDKAPEKIDGCSFKVLSFDEVIALGAEGGKVTFTPPSPDNLGVIMYTSGSTGKPKGVMIKHKSMVASVAAVRTKFLSFGLKEGEERYLAYLPAAHILELMAETGMFSFGAAVGFACPKTISSKGACRQRPNGSVNMQPSRTYPPGAIQEFAPTVMAAVPKIWDILKKGVEEVVGKGSPTKRFLFQVAYTARYFAATQNRESPLFKAVVFSKLQEMLGGNLVVGLTGGGPISADVQGFIRTAFCLPLLQGYALTETACAGCIQEYVDTRPGVCGPPVSSVELKLRSCFDDKANPECLDRQQQPYSNSDTNHYGVPCKGRGEVLIRGPSVSSGYFKQADKTAEVFDKDGWFHTGDVGVFTPDGCLMIVDRLKNLVKLKGGEYIAIEAMEKEYSTSPFVNGVNGGLMCYGDGDMDRPVALVQANTAELEKWAKSENVTYKDVEALCKLPVAEKVVLDSLVAAGKAGNLAANEKLACIALIPGTGPAAGTATATSPWMPENGGLTASNKLNRKPIQAAYKELLEPLRKKAGA